MMRVSLAIARRLRRPRGGLARSFSAASPPEHRGDLFIDNEYVKAEGGATLPVYAPRDGQEFTSIANASVGDVDAAILSAKRCFDGPWRDTTPAQRAEVLLRMGGALEARLEQFAEVESFDCGKVRYGHGKTEGVPSQWDHSESAAAPSKANGRERDTTLRTWTRLSRRESDGVYAHVCSTRCAGVEHPASNVHRVSVEVSVEVCIGLWSPAHVQHSLFHTTTPLYHICRTATYTIISPPPHITTTHHHHPIHPIHPNHTHQPTNCTYHTTPHHTTQPLSESRGDIQFCADLFKYYAELGPKVLVPRSVHVDEDGMSSSIVREVEREEGKRTPPVVCCVLCAVCYCCRIHEAHPAHRTDVPELDVRTNASVIIHSHDMSWLLG